MEVVPKSEKASNILDEPSAEPPPSYSALASPLPAAGPTSGSDPGDVSKDDPFDFLRVFDTIFLIDDSYSMTGSSWREVADVLKSITPICAERDADGIDIYFLNKSDERQFHQIKSPDEVDRIFRLVSPNGATPTGSRLNDILKPYLKDVKERGDKVRPLNIIVITDGQPTDDPKRVIIDTAKKLDDLEASPWQVGIQFFQVGKDDYAAKALRHLDDDLAGQDGGIRDIVDTVPWSLNTDGSRLNSQGILKVVLGAVNRRLDRKPIAELLR